MTDVLEITSSLVSRKVQLINNVPNSLPCITGDSDRLVQIMYNLIGNAGECMHYGAAARLAKVGCWLQSLHINARGLTV